MAESTIRVALREALLRVITDRKMVRKELAERSAIDEGQLSRFLASRASVTTQTFDSMLDALSDEEYKYFLLVLHAGMELLHEPLPQDLSLPTSGDEDLRYKAFLGLFASVLSSCSRDQMDEMLILIGESLKKRAH